MLRTQRQAQILQQLQRDGFVEIAALGRLLAVDRSTVRRDLDELEGEKLLRRTRGGAISTSTKTGFVNVPYLAKRSENLAEKRAIGQLAASLVKSGETVILDAGSTTFQVAVALQQRRDISVVTNDLRIAIYLADSPRVQLLVTGGIVMEAQYTLVGPNAVSGLGQLHADRLFLGADAVHPDFGATNTSLVEIDVKRAMISAAHEVVLVAGSSKFGQRSLVPICSLEEVDLVVTDDQVDVAGHPALDGKLTVAPVAPGESRAHDGLGRRLPPTGLAPSGAGQADDGRMRPVRTSASRTHAI